MWLVNCFVPASVVFPEPPLPTVAILMSLLNCDAESNFRLIVGVVELPQESLLRQLQKVPSCRAQDCSVHMLKPLNTVVVSQYFSEIEEP